MSAQWDVLDSRSHALEWVERIGIHIPGIRARKCYAVNASSLVCNRAKGHTGRHVATISRGAVVAVWK